jgi:hypothetical protein
MKVYSFYNNINSIPNESNIQVTLPIKNMNYYPMLIRTHVDLNSFSNLKNEISITIDFSFANFDGSSSGIYDYSNKLYNSYVGVYYLKGANNSLDKETAYELVAYDSKHLALPALGLSSNEATFKVTNYTVKPDFLIDELYWSVYNAKIIMNGPEHPNKGFLPSYIQFGTPPENSSSYPKRDMYGTMYCRYFENLNVNICIYASAKDKETLEEIKSKILTQATVKYN